MKKVMITVILFLAIMPFVLGDAAPYPSEDYKTISVNNHITNLNEFPDYIFFVASGTQAVSDAAFASCPLQIVGSDGQIDNNNAGGCRYASVYAVKKSDETEDNLRAMSVTELHNLTNSPIVKTVFLYLSFSQSVLTSDSRTEFDKPLTINSTKLASQSVTVDESPYERIITIRNYITNLDEFPDYILFITAPTKSYDGNMADKFTLCPVGIIRSDSSINHYAPISSGLGVCSSVYAVRKSDITESELKSLDEIQLRKLCEGNSQSVPAIEIFSNLTFSKTVRTSSTLSYEDNPLTISLKDIENGTSKKVLIPSKTCPEGSTNENNTCKKTLSNGKAAEIKIMPETASENAIARLGDLGFNIQLKEVGTGSDSKAVYELTGNKQGKFLGIFRITAKVQAQVDAGTGEVKVIKPWWAILTTGI